MGPSRSSSENDGRRSITDLEETAAIHDRSKPLIAPRDPFKHWSEKSNISSCVALINFVKAALCVGILRLPEKTKAGGLVTSVISGIVVFVLSLTAIHTIIRIQEKVANHNEREYICFPDVLYVKMKAGPVWCRRAASFVKNSSVISIILYQMVICALYINVMSYKSVYQFGVGSGNTRVQIIEILLIIPLLILLAFVKRLKHITYISALGIIGVVILHTLGYYVIISNKDKFTCPEGNIEHLPYLMGNYLFFSHNFGVAIMVHGHMRNHQTFRKLTGTLNQTYFVIFFTAIIAVLLSCFPLAPNPDSNFYSGFSNRSRTFIGVIYSLILILSIPLNFQVCAEFISHYYFYLLPKAYPVSFVVYTIRFLLIMCIVILALIIPGLIEVYSLLGLICCSIVSMMLPGIAEIVHTLQTEENQWKTTKTISLDIIIILTGLYFLSIGVYNFINDIDLAIFYTRKIV